MFKFISVNILILLFATGCSAGDAQTNALRHASFFDPFFGEFAQELQDARSQGKKGILLFFDMRGCPYCKRMKEQVLNQALVQDYYAKHFLRFSVDIEGGIEVVDFKGKEMTEKQFAAAHRVFGTPLFSFIDLTGKEVARYQGATSGVEEFLQLGAYVVDGAYQSQSFAQYQAAQKVTKLP